MSGVSASEAIFVGDSLREDIRGARRVGMRTVLISPEQLNASGADWTIYKLAELVPIVERGLS